MTWFAQQQVPTMAANKLAKAADNWSAGVSRSGGAWTDGVKAVTESPTVTAIKSKGRMVSGFNAAMNDGTYEAGCNRVTAQSWQASCSARSGNYTQSATTKKSKYQQYIQQAGPAIAQIQAAANAMPSDTLDQRIQKSVYVQQQMAALRGKFRSA